jgi:hypothetical protein
MLALLNVHFEHRCKGKQLQPTLHTAVNMHEIITTSIPHISVFFTRHFRVLVSEYFPNRVVGNYQTFSLLLWEYGNRT